MMRCFITPQCTLGRRAAGKRDAVSPAVDPRNDRRPLGARGRVGGTVLGAVMRETVVASHLHELSASGWSLWRSVCVRGAGFPAELVLALASPETSRELDRLLELELEVAQATARALAALEIDRASHTVRAERHAVTKQMRRLEAGMMPDARHVDSAGSAGPLDALRAAAGRHQEARAAAGQTFAAERQRLSRAIRGAARDPRFREALVWQNRGALHNGIDVLLRHDDTVATAKTREYERLVANHLQRYCVKNDSIGFFGPVGWARLAREPEQFSVRPGRQLLATRTVYFEYWGIDALAGVIAQDPRLRRHLAPRRHPTVWLDGTALHHPVERTSELGLAYARLLAACDGERSAHAIARELVQDPALELADEDEVYELLDELTTLRLVVWTLEISPRAEHPDRALAALLEAVEDQDAAAPGLAKLAELSAAREAVARAAGDADALDRALARLDETFTRHTETAAARRHGETYAARTLVYEDCRRDLDMAIGPAVIDRISAPLALLLTSTRWFTFTLAQRTRELLVALHRDLARETGSSTVDFLRFWERASGHFNAPGASPMVSALTEELQRRWATLVGLEGAVFDQQRLDLTVAQLAAAAAPLFAAPCPGWPSARHHAPDLMIAASSVEAIARGDFTVVSGELHTATPTVATPCLLRQHPHPEEIVAAMTHDRPAPVIEAVAAKEGALRSDKFSFRVDDLDLEIGMTRSWRPRGQVVEAGALVVEPAAGSLRMRTRDGTRSFTFEELLDSVLSAGSLAHFKVMAPARHCPRVSLDGLVIHRESWRFAPAELAFTRIDDPIDRMVATRRWARAHRLPRFVFYKVPHEIKPCYLDLDSPHYVERLALMARNAAELTVSEMLPAIDQSWLPDADGAHYTCELRIVAVDPEPWRLQP
jgi:Lantibiotic dehydratase, N terminus